MGRIKGTLVKRTTRELMELYPDSWTPDFEKNKSPLKKIMPALQKKMRNSIAGFIARKKKRELKNKK